MKTTDDYVVAWRIWYSTHDDFIEYNSVQHCFEDLPDDGFQRMRLWFSDGTGRFLGGYDYYFFVQHPKGIIYGQTNNEVDLKKYPGCIVKTGRHIPDGLLQEIEKLVFNSKSPLDGA